MKRADVPRTIKLMADYECSPLWEPGADPYPIEPEDLPLTETLRDRLWSWAKTYDATLNWDDPRSSDFTSKEVRQQFIQEGAALVGLLRAELGPSFEVIYYDKY